MSEETTLETPSEEDIQVTSHCCGSSVGCENICGEVKKTVCYLCYNFDKAPCQDQMRSK